LRVCLDRAEQDKRPIAKITNQYPDMNWEDAYLVQDALRKAQRGAGAGGVWESRPVLNLARQDETDGS